LSRWRLREQMLDGATTGGGRATQSVVVATEDDDDGWDLPHRRHDGNGCGDASVPSDQRRRRLRRNERGGGDDKGQASGVDSPSRGDASELEAWWWRGLVI
jgi:hypothetical protein